MVSTFLVSETWQPYLWMVYIWPKKGLADRVSQPKESWIYQLTQCIVYESVLWHLSTIAYREQIIRRMPESTLSECRMGPTFASSHPLLDPAEFEFNSSSLPWRAWKLKWFEFKENEIFWEIDVTFDFLQGVNSFNWIYGSFEGKNIILIVLLRPWTNTYMDALKIITAISIRYNLYKIKWYQSMKWKKVSSGTIDQHGRKIWAFESEDDYMYMYCMCTLVPYVINIIIES